MTRRPLLALAGTIALLVCLTGLAAAAPGGGPPADASSPVPEFVTQGLDAIGGIAGEVLEFVTGLTPDAADDGLETAAGAVSG